MIARAQPRPETPPPQVVVSDMSKRFGSLTALDGVSIRFESGSFHALLGENGAGKSTLVKCMMGYYHADAGSLAVNGRVQRVANPRHARHLGLGMVYQHFTLVPSMTVAENLVVGEEGLPAVIEWRRYRDKLEAFLATMPFRLELDRTVTSLAAGEKQKLEILKQLYLGSRFLILDEPTSVLTPDESDELLGLMRTMADDGRISLVLITHKLREVEAHAREVSVLRHGRLAGQGLVGDLDRGELVRMMIGRENVPAPASRNVTERTRTVLGVRELSVDNDKGLTAVAAASVGVAEGEIVGIAGVSGNGQTELVEALAGQRRIEGGEIAVRGVPYRRTRGEMRSLRVVVLPEQPLVNGCVRSMSVAENLALRNFDRPPNTVAGWLVNHRAIRRQAHVLIERFKIRTQGPEARIETLSGGNVQRTVLARELAEPVDVLIAQNPCFGLDLNAAAEIRNLIVNARNAGAAVLLISEDLDEILELADRIVVMFEGRFVYETAREAADVHVIGRQMAGRA
jgi:simple sugar transport system ATP-binding protein